uniref:Pre-rRNA-processing protein TSR2 n=2 Tax=Anthurium amnicola TaxID=1678845 RepID=A0A1D1Y354_9ARAE
MDPTREGQATPQQKLSPDAHPLFVEGVSLVLSRWTALQMAVEDGWGGKDSRDKSQELESAVVSWFTQSNDPLYIDDLESMLDDGMVLSFNAEIEDGSIEEVALQLMIIHEECIQGNYASIERLRKSKHEMHAISQSKRVINGNDDESSDEEVSDMMVDEPKPSDLAVDKPKPREVVDEEGWTVISSRRNKGKSSS